MDEPDGQPACPYLSYDPVLIRYPLRVLLYIFLHSVMLGVEDVHAVLGCSYSVFIYVVIAVTTNVISLVNNQTLNQIRIITRKM